MLIYFILFFWAGFALVIHCLHVNTNYSSYRILRNEWDDLTDLLQRGLISLDQYHLKYVDFSVAHEQLKNVLISYQTWLTDSDKLCNALPEKVTKYEVSLFITLISTFWKYIVVIIVPRDMVFFVKPMKSKSFIIIYNIIRRLRKLLFILN